MALLEGKTGVIFGIANHRSIAWPIAQIAEREGATLVLSYFNDRVERYVRELAEKLSRPPMLVQCDVSDDAQVERLYAEVRERYPRLDFVVHSIAFANRENLEGRFVDTSREDFRLALDASAYSLTAVTRGALPLLSEGGSVITLTYLGSVRAMQNYNVMGVAKAALEASVRYLAADLGPQGIRVNAISAGPIQTLSARGIAGFTDFHKSMNERSALHRTIDVREVAETAAFLLGPASSGITGQVIYVDAGFNIMGV
ncbi:MAG TPA: enoyl-ACP reductase [Chloroflexota bacterium]|jgi:enoyl-[acyl-carrier protein] reductase I|nr:enoyl-ACP reductase [Chloroflexota bacterium]